LLNASLQVSEEIITASAVITYCHSLILLKNKTIKRYDDIYDVI